AGNVFQRSDQLPGIASDAGIPAAVLETARLEQHAESGLHRGFVAGSVLGSAGTMGSMPNSRSLMPFTALVGQEAMKTALVLNAINPGIGGVLIRGQRGTAKSTAVRALARLLPDIDVIVGCRYRCDP